MVIAGGSGCDQFELGECANDGLINLGSGVSSENFEVFVGERVEVEDIRGEVEFVAG